MNYNKWVSIFGSAVSIAENKPEAYAKNITLRYPIQIPFSGDQLKLTLDNFCGTETITIENVTILYKELFYPVSFTGQMSASIEAGSSITCDPVNIEVTEETTAYISIYLKDYTQMRSCVYLSGPLSEGLYATGNQANTMDIPIDISRKTNIYYFLTNVSVRTSAQKHAILCFGDSITAQAWPDYLNIRCKNEGLTDTVAIRKAASGSRLLRQYSCITYESYGLSGHNRYMHEFQGDGIDTIIIQQGINDLIHPVGEEVNPFRPMTDLPTVQQMIDEVILYINYAHSLGYKVYVGTLLPIEGWRTYADFREKMRNEYNHWIRTNTLADGCIDFDEAVRSKQNPKAFADGFDSGDHLHPSLKGYEQMAKAIPTEYL